MSIEGRKDNRSFKLPDFSNRVIQGGTAGTYKAAGLPNITGGYGIICNGSNSSTTRWYAYGAMYQETTATRNVGSSGAAASGHGLALDASRSSSIYGNSTTVQPPALCVNICIKF